MSLPNVYAAAGPGRPEFDHLAIFLWVTAAADLTGMTINKFCDRASLGLLGVTIVPDDNQRLKYSAHRTRLEQRRPTYLKGTTLKRRFYAAKKKVLAELGCAGTVLIERLVAEMKSQLRREAGL